MGVGHNRQCVEHTAECVEDSGEGDVGVGV